MKKIIINFLLVFVVLSAFAVDWPQPSVDLSAFRTQFASSRKSSLSAGVVFSNPENVKTVDASV